jgi:hypothetical protein
MKEINPVGQIVNLNITTFATRLRLLLELCIIDLYAIKLNIVSSVLLLFSFKRSTQV